MTKELVLIFVALDLVADVGEFLIIIGNHNPPGKPSICSRATFFMISFLCEGKC